jgi:Icc-related predicted phosphoesterase
MATGRVRRILAAAEPRGDIGRLTQLLELTATTGADAIAMLGDLTADGDTKAYRDVFKALGAARVQTFWVPGPRDAPLAAYLRESSNLEAVFPFLHGVHGTIALTPDYVLFAGMGGEIVDDPDAKRGEEAMLRYPGWEVEYRLKIIREFKDRRMVFLFTTPPAHKGLGAPGSEVLAELIKTYNPRLVFVRGEGVAEERIGKSLVVSPGRLDQGEYALVDLYELTVEAAVPASEATV